MKKVIIREPNQIEYLEENGEEFGLADYEVLVKPVVGGICGTDVHILKGSHIGTYPIVPCHEFTAVVTKTGKKVTKIKIGDQVAIDPNIRCGRCEQCLKGNLNCCLHYSAVGVTQAGGFSEYVVVHENNAYPFKHVTHEEMAFAEPLSCVLHGQRQLSFHKNSQVVIFGAGGIGLLQLLLCHRIHKVDTTVVDIEENHLDLARQLGANHLVLSDNHINEKLAGIAPHGFDIAIDCCGNESVVGVLFNHLGKNGEALLFSVYKEGIKLALFLHDIFMNNWKIFGSLTYNREFAEAVRIIDSNELTGLTHLVGNRVKLKDVPYVLSNFAQYANKGKVQVLVN